MPNKAPAKVLIVDDHPLVREGLSMRIALHSEFLVCGEAASETEALAKIRETKPDLAIIDLSLESGHGLSLIKQIRAHHPSVKMLVVSGYQESLFGERCLRAGALGYLNKQQSNDNVIDGMRTVLRGERYVTAAMTERLVSHALKGVVDDGMQIDRLSPREIEVFRLIGLGLTSGAIAEQLFLSTHTIDTHRENIKRKLGLDNAGELSRAAVQWVLEND